MVFRAKWHKFSGRHCRAFSDGCETVRRGHVPAASPLKQIREGLGYIRHHTTVRPLITLVAVSNMFALGYMALLPAFAQEVLHTGKVGYGFMSTAIGVGALRRTDPRLARQLPAQRPDPDHWQPAFPGHGHRPVIVYSLHLALGIWSLQASGS